MKIFSNNDVSILLGNILDNAIEGSEKEDGEYRLIKLNIQTKGNLLVLTEMNYTKNHPMFLEGLPKTNKGNESVHGYGLKSIKYICEKYNGEMEVKMENDTFLLNIVFPLNKQKLILSNIRQFLTSKSHCLFSSYKIFLHQFVVNNVKNYRKDF